MDPIHPILPQPVNIPPVRPSSAVGRINRDGARDGGAHQRAKRDAERRHRESQPEAEDEGHDGPHVDLTA